jgi:hypothetical protein
MEAAQGQEATIRVGALEIHRAQGIAVAGGTAGLGCRPARVRPAAANHDREESL